MRRLIMHIDANSAFLSWSACENIRLGGEDYRLIPSAVGGDEQSRKGIILAKSIPAKDFGIVTGEAIFSAKLKCPSLLVVPPDYDLYLQKSGEMFKLLSEYSPICERYSIDECFIDYTGMERLFGAPKECADIIRSRIKNELGFTVNVGIGENKLLAKMASELKKPDMTHTIYKNEVAEKMHPLPIEKLFMCGPKTSAKLKKVGIHTIGKLAETPRELIIKILGDKSGILMHNYACGTDQSPVIENGSVPAKSFSNSITTPENMVTYEDILDVLFPLCDIVSRRMRKENFLASVIGISLKNTNFELCSAQKKTVLPIFAQDDIFRNSKELLLKLWDGKPLRAAGVFLSGLSQEKGDQLNLFDSKKELKMRLLCPVEDRVRNKYGDGMLTRASLLNKNMKKYHCSNFIANR